MLPPKRANAKRCCLKEQVREGLTPASGTPEHAYHCGSLNRGSAKVDSKVYHRGDQRIHQIEKRHASQKQLLSPKVVSNLLDWNFSFLRWHTKRFRRLLVSNYCIAKVATRLEFINSILYWMWRRPPAGPVRRLPTARAPLDPSKITRMAIHARKVIQSSKK